MSEVQLYVLAVAAAAIVWLVKVLAQAKVTIHRGWLTAGVYVVAGLLAWAWSAPIFPAFPAWGELGAFVPALLAWITDLFEAVGPVVALATLVYNALLKQVLDKLGEAALRRFASG